MNVSLQFIQLPKICIWGPIRFEFGSDSEKLADKILPVRRAMQMSCAGNSHVTSQLCKWARNVTTDWRHGPEYANQPIDEHPTRLWSVAPPRGMLVRILSAGKRAEGGGNLAPMRHPPPHAPMTSPIPSATPITAARRRAQVPRWN